MAKSKRRTSPKVESKRFRETAYFHEARLSGYTYAQIADKASSFFGYRISPSKVEERIKRMRAEREVEQVESLRQLEADRLDRYLAAIEAPILNPPTIELSEGIVSVDHDMQLKAIDKAVKISDRRSKLLGLDAPVRSEVTVLELTTEDLELVALANEAKARRDLVLEGGAA